MNDDGEKDIVTEVHVFLCPTLDHRGSLISKIATLDAQMTIQPRLRFISSGRNSPALSLPPPVEAIFHRPRKQHGHAALFPNQNTSVWRARASVAVSKQSSVIGDSTAG